MKKVKLLAICAIAMLMLVSCGKEDESNPFVGIWGVEKIEYYNIDYAGNPITDENGNYIDGEIINFPVGDPSNGIDLVFRENKTGEIRDKDIDTLYFDYDTVTHTYQTIIPCPDSVFVTPCPNYIYDEKASALYITPLHERPFMMKISNLSDNSFTYENEYAPYYVERAYLKRVSSDAKMSPAKHKRSRPYKPGAFLGGRRYN